MRKLLFVLFVAVVARPAIADQAVGTPSWSNLLSANFNVKSTWTGTVTMNVTSVVSPGPAGTLQNMSFLAGNSWRVFCIDLKEGSDATTFDMVSLDQAPTPPGYGQAGSMGLTKAGQIASMWKAGIGNALSSVFNSQAFQIAIWEVVNETGNAYDITSGSFFLTGGNADTAAMKNKVAQYLSYVNNADQAAVWAFRSNGKQDFVGGHVPSPATSIQLLGLGGMLGLVGFVRRRRRS